MATIPQLNAVDQVSSDDQVPIYKSSEANAMRVPASAFVALVSGTAIEQMAALLVQAQQAVTDAQTAAETVLSASEDWGLTSQIPGTTEDWGTAP